MNEEKASFKGNFVVGYAKESPIYINQVHQNCQDQSFDEIISEIFTELQQKYPNISENEKPIIFKAEIQRVIENDSELKKRILNSLKSGGYELTKVLMNNPFVHIPLEMFKGWFET